MTDEELRERIKKEVGVSDETIDNFCEANRCTIYSYSEHIDKAMIARGWLTFDSDSNRTVKIPKSTVMHLKQDNN